MPIDTAAKRLSIMDFGDETAPGIPVPDGAITAPDREHFLWLYSGISLAAFVAVEIIADWVVRSRRLGNR